MIVEEPNAPYFHISNIGEETVYNVSFEVETDGAILPPDAKKDLPWEILNPGEHFSVRMVRYDGMPSKYKVRVVWQDGNNNKQSAEFLVAR